MGRGGGRCIVYAPPLSLGYFPFTHNIFRQPIPENSWPSETLKYESENRHWVGGLRSIKVLTAPQLQLHIRSELYEFQSFCYYFLSYIILDVIFLNM